MEANRQDEKLSGVVMDKEAGQEIYSHYEMKQRKNHGSNSGKDEDFKAEAAAELTSGDQDFKPNMEKVHEMTVDSHGIRKP